MNRLTDSTVAMAITISVFLCLSSYQTAVQGQEPPTTKKASNLKTIFAGPVGAFPSLGSCKLTYKVSWKDKLEAGQVQVELNEEEDVIQVSATGETTGATHALLPIEGEFMSLIDTASLETRAMEQTEKRKDKTLQSSVEIDQGTVRIKKSLKLGAADAEIKLSPLYKSNHPVFDLVSSALFIRSQPLSEKGEIYTLVVIPKSTPGPFTATVVGKEKREHQGEMVDCIKLEVTPDRAHWRVEETQSAKETEAKKETVTLTQDIKKRFRGILGKCTVWVSDDELRLPLEATIEVAPIGEVVIQLVEFAK